MSRERLEEGNARFTESADRQLLERLACGQSPYACVVTCSDSRVPPEMIFSAGPGELFVVRTAGNVTTEPMVLGSVEYAVDHLNVPVVVMLGHSDCGAIKASMADGCPEGNCGTLVECIREMGMEGTLEELIERNVRIQVENLRRMSKIIRLAEESGKTSLLPAFYVLSDGSVHFL